MNTCPGNTPHHSGKRDLQECPKSLIEARIPVPAIHPKSIPATMHPTHDALACVCVCVCVEVCVCVCVRACSTQVCLSVCLCVCLSSCAMCVCVITHTHTPPSPHMITRIHTHTHTPLFPHINARLCAPTITKLNKPPYTRTCICKAGSSPAAPSCFHIAKGAQQKIGAHSPIGIQSGVVTPNHDHPSAPSNCSPAQVYR